MIVGIVFGLISIASCQPESACSDQLTSSPSLLLADFDAMNAVTDGNLKRCFGTFFLANFSVTFFGVFLFFFFFFPFEFII